LDDENARHEVTHVAKKKMMEVMVRMVMDALMIDITMY
jgi:hypothetical protein